MSLAPYCEWRTLRGLGSDHLPIEIVLPLSPVRHPNTRPPKFNYRKAIWDDYQSYIVEHLPSLDVDAVNIHKAARSFSLFLVEAAKASIPFGCLGHSLKAWWSQEAESAVREQWRARSEAHQSEAHRLRYIYASSRAFSVISRAKSATWQATCSNLALRSDPPAVLRLLNAISGKKNTSQDPSFPSYSSPLDTANHYASYLCSHLSQATPRTSRRVERHLAPRSDPRAVFRLLNAISGKKNTSQDPSFTSYSSPLDTANHYTSYLCSHLSQATPRTSRRAERQFMNELRKASCEEASSLHSSFCSPFSLAELSTAICKFSSSTTSGPKQDILTRPT